jgi:hypothetical protein
MQRPTRRTLTLLIGLAGLLIVAACGEPQQPTPTTYGLEVAVVGTGTGTVTSDVGGISVATGDDASTTTFNAGTTVTLTATAADGSTFTGWEGDCSGTGTCEVTLDANASVTARFGVATPGTATLTVATNGDGNVTSSPAGIDVAAGDTSIEVDVGTTVTLTATPGDGFTFGGWSGGGCSASGTGPCDVEVNANVTVTAFFFDDDTDLVTETFVIAQGSDDAEEFLADFGNEFYDRGGTTLASGDLDLTYDAAFDVKVAVGLRFANVDLPSDAVVTDATITFTRIGATSPGTVTLDFVGQASDDAPTFVEGSANFNITNRDTTTAEVAWNWVGSWTTATATSPDLSSIVNEVLQRDGWSVGNALAFIITSDDSNELNFRRAVSYETNPATAPVLSITYYVPPAP